MEAAYAMHQEGFAEPTRILVFSSEIDRDRFLEISPSTQGQALTRKEAITVAWFMLRSRVGELSICRLSDDLPPLISGLVDELRFALLGEIRFAPLFDPAIIERRIENPEDVESRSFEIYRLADGEYVGAWRGADSAAALLEYLAAREPAVTRIAGHRESYFTNYDEALKGPQWAVKEAGVESCA